MKYLFAQQLSGKLVQFWDLVLCCITFPISQFTITYIYRGSLRNCRFWNETEYSEWKHCDFLYTLQNKKILFSC